MPEYRIYIVGSDGHFYDSVPLECDDDTDAAEKAKQLVMAMTLNSGSATAR
jgi:hypothetical protein